MSTAAAPLPSPLTPRAADRSRDARPTLARLTKVELRKMTDTRAGFWLLLSLFGVTALVVVITALEGPGADHRLQPMLYNALQPGTVLLSIIGILLVTSEWSQRTAMVTFALVPQRGRVLLAKALASLVLSAVAFALTAAMAAVATAIAASGVDGQWSLGVGLLGQMAFSTGVSMLMGVAFGAALLLSAPAIVASFAAPIAVSAATHIVHPLRGVGQWIDQARTLPDLLDHVYSADEWAKTAVTLALWLALPLAVGAYRFTRGEIR
jgi:ABC-2 type transport system permease protein